MRFLWHFQKRAIKKLEPEPRKTGKSVFIKKKIGINNNMVAILISCDPKGNHLQAASRGRISAKAINPVLKDKLEAQNSFMYRRGHRSFEAFSKENKLAHQTVKVSAKQYKKEIYHAQHIKQHKKRLDEKFQWCGNKIFYRII